MELSLSDDEDFDEFDEPFFGDVSDDQFASVILSMITQDPDRIRARRLFHSKVH